MKKAEMGQVIDLAAARAAKDLKDKRISTCGCAGRCLVCWAVKNWAAAEKARKGKPEGER